MSVSYLTGETLLGFMLKLFFIYVWVYLKILIRATSVGILVCILFLYLYLSLIEQSPEKKLFCVQKSNYMIVTYLLYSVNI